MKLLCNGESCWRWHLLGRISFTPLTSLMTKMVAARVAIVGAITITALFASISGPSYAAGAEMINFSFKDADSTKVIEEYAKASGQKFVVDPSATGKVTIINTAPVTLDEAFNQLSLALAVNDEAISKHNDVMVVSHARNMQRDWIQVSSELPPMSPQQMFTWVVKLKHISADSVNKELRMLNSKDGEIFPYAKTNQLIICDWVTNLHRVAKILAEIDVPNAGEGKKTKSKE